jgi:exoribonuclease R
MASVPEKSVMNTVKVWLFPTVISILALMLYDDIKEIKSDVKQLLAQSASDHAEIMNLKNQVEKLNNKVFATNFPENSPKVPLYPEDTIRITMALVQDDSNRLYIKKKPNI